MDEQPLVATKQRRRRSSNARFQWLLVVLVVLSVWLCSLHSTTEKRQSFVSSLVTTATTISQVSLSIVDVKRNGFVYSVRYATTKPEPTHCEATCQCHNLKLWTSNGSGRFQTYSALRSFNAVYFEAGGVYTSPYLHTCILEKPLPERCQCTYRISNSDTQFKFHTPPLPGSKGNFTLALVADVGQTKYSGFTMNAMKKFMEENNASTILFPGDLSYADGEQVRWDSFAHLMQPLLSQTEAIYAPGNHEVENGESYVAYRYRYQESLQHVQRRGPVHTISLCSYCEWTTTSPAYAWLVKAFGDVERSVTPLLIVLMHGPWYCSSENHEGELEHLRVLLEPLFLQFRVDLVVQGHVHAFERTTGIANNQVSKCGPVYLTVGAGGNREKASTSWSNPPPEWSVKRQSAFGFGGLVVNETGVISWTWYRNPPGEYDFPGQDVPKNMSFERDVAVIDRSECLFS